MSNNNIETHFFAPFPTGLSDIWGLQKDETPPQPARSTSDSPRNSRETSSAHKESESHQYGVGPFHGLGFYWDTGGSDDRKGEEPRYVGIDPTATNYKLLAPPPALRYEDSTADTLADHLRRLTVVPAVSPVLQPRPAPSHTQCDNTSPHTGNNRNPNHSDTGSRGRGRGRQERRSAHYQPHYYLQQQQLHQASLAQRPHTNTSSLPNHEFFSLGPDWDRHPSPISPIRGERVVTAIVPPPFRGDKKQLEVDSPESPQSVTSSYSSRQAPTPYKDRLLAGMLSTSDLKLGSSHPVEEQSCKFAEKETTDSRRAHRAPCYSPGGLEDGARMSHDGGGGTPMLMIPTSSGNVGPTLPLTPKQLVHVKLASILEKVIRSELKFAPKGSKETFKKQHCLQLVTDSRSRLKKKRPTTVAQASKLFIKNISPACLLDDIESMIKAFEVNYDINKGQINPPRVGHYGSYCFVAFDDKSTAKRVLNVINDEVSNTTVPGSEGEGSYGLKLSVQFYEQRQISAAASSGTGSGCSSPSG